MGDRIGGNRMRSKLQDVYKKLIPFILSIRTRIIFCFSMIIIVVIFMTTIIFIKMEEISKNDQEIAEISLPALIETTTINNEMFYINKLINEVSNTTMSNSIRRLKEEIDVSVERIESGQKELEPFVEHLNNEKLEQNYLDFTSKWIEYKNRVYNIVDLALSDDQAGAKEELFISIAYFDNANQALLGIVSGTKERIEAGVDQSVELNRIGIRWTLIISGSAIIFMIAVIYITIRWIIKPISKISDQVQTVASGDFTVKPLTIQTNDELGKMGTNFNLMTDSMKSLL